MAIRLGQPSVHSYTWLPTDHNLLTWSVQPEFVSAGTVLSPAGLLYLTRVHLPVTATVTNVAFHIVTAGATLTAGQCFAALYTAAGARLAQTADQATAWASTGFKEMALAGGPYSLSAADYYVGWWFNGTTGPSVGRGSGLAVIGNLKLTSPDLRFATADTGLTTTAPATFGAQTAGSNAFFAALS